jgi:hypothetical protein
MRNKFLRHFVVCFVTVLNLFFSLGGKEIKGCSWSPTSAGLGASGICEILELQVVDLTRRRSVQQLQCFVERKDSRL